MPPFNFSTEMIARMRRHRFRVFRGGGRDTPRYMTWGGARLFTADGREVVFLHRRRRHHHKN